MLSISRIFYFFNFSASAVSCFNKTEHFSGMLFKCDFPTLKAILQVVPGGLMAYWSCHCLPSFNAVQIMCLRGNLWGAWLTMATWTIWRVLTSHPHAVKSAGLLQCLIEICSKLQNGNWTHNCRNVYSWGKLTFQAMNYLESLHTSLGEQCSRKVCKLITKKNLAFLCCILKSFPHVPAISEPRMCSHSCNEGNCY